MDGCGGGEEEAASEEAERGVVGGAEAEDEAGGDGRRAEESGGDEAAVELVSVAESSAIWEIVGERIRIGRLVGASTGEHGAANGGG